MTFLRLLGMVGLVAVLANAGCGDSDDGGGGGGGGGGCTAGTEACACDAGSCDAGLRCAANVCVQTVVINFSIDDSANQTYGAGDLEWKGSFTYDAASGILTHDPAWGGGTGPYPPLYDDGPAASGGHEPDGATAGDNIWGIAVHVLVPTQNLDFEYGAQTSAGGWIWQGPNGTFTVAPGATTPITATGMTIGAFGTTDLRLTLDVTALDTSFTYTAGDTVRVKGSYASWEEIDCVDNGTLGDETAGDDIYTFVLGQNVGAGTSYPHAGLLQSADTPQFVFVIEGVEYRGDIGGGTTGCYVDGVAADTMPAGGSWAQQTITLSSGENNTMITVP